MSISATETSITYAGNASSSTPYPITFRYFDSDHISVYADGVEISDRCTFSGDGNNNTGAFTTYFGYASTVEIVVVLDVPLDQPTVLQENQLLPAKTIEEDGFDRLNMQIRRAYRWALGALRLDNSEGGASTGTANSVIGFDDDGDISDEAEIWWMSDVNAESPGTGEVLMWDGTEWINSTPNIVNYPSSGITYTPAGTGAVDTTMQAKLRESVSVQDFGAVGDGTTDDYAAIQLALDHKGTIIVPDGTYSVSAQLRIHSDSTLKMSKHATIRRNFNDSPLGKSLLGVTTGSSNVVVSGGTLDTNGQNYPTNANCVGGNTITNVTFDGTRLLNVPSLHALDFANTSGLTVRDCQFLGFADLTANTRFFSEAIQTDGDVYLGTSGSNNYNFVVTGCYFGENPDNNTGSWTSWPVALGNHAGGDDKYTYKVLFSDNIVVGATYAAVRALNWKDVIISNNVFEDFTRGVLLSHHFKIDESGFNACDNITIEGNIFRDGTKQAIYSSSDSNFGEDHGSIKHSGVNIVGNTIRTTGSDPAIDLQWVQNCTVVGNNMRNVDSGIDIKYCSQLTISGNQIVLTTAANGIWIYEEGFFVGAGVTNDILITGNQMNDLYYRGIHLNCAAVGVRIIGNYVFDPDGEGEGREGIKVDTGPSNVSVNGNTVYWNGTPTGDGISVSTGTNVKVIGNDADGVSDAYVIAAAGTYVEIADAGTPESVVSAAIGSTYRRLDGGASTTLYIKESGTGNTGWAAK